jgi:hypothetical protein
MRLLLKTTSCFIVDSHSKNTKLTTWFDYGIELSIQSSQGYLGCKITKLALKIKLIELTTDELFRHFKFFCIVRY